MMYRFTVEFALDLPDEAAAMVVEGAIDDGADLLRAVVKTLTGQQPIKEPGKAGVFIGVPARVSWDEKVVDWVAQAREEES